MTQVRLQPAAPRSRIKHSTTEPLHSHSRTLSEWQTFCIQIRTDILSRRGPYIKIAIRGDGKSPDQKVIDMQLQAANLLYIFDVIILSVTANKSGRLTVETSFLPLNSQASSYKVHSREITYKSSKGEQQFLNARHPLDLLYIYTIYYQNISKDIKVIERTSFPL